MPHLGFKICPSCNKRIPHNERYCEDHKDREKAFGRKVKANDPFYSSRRWRKVRKAYLGENPLCADCEDRGETTPATVVDHILPRSTHPQFEWDTRNFKGLCASDHNSKTAKQQKR